MEKFTEDEKSIINYVLTSLLGVVRQEIENTPDGGEITQAVKTEEICINLLEKIKTSNIW